MRKRMLSAAMAGMMVVSMTACGGSKPAETTAAATEAETSAEESTAEETTAEAADEAGELGGTFTVGFDQDFPPMGFVGDDGEYTWSWQRKLLTDWALSLFRSRSHGTQRIWN